MTQAKNPDIGYVTGLITGTGVIAVIAASENLEEQDIDHSFLAIWKDKNWTIFEEDFSIISLAAGRGSFVRTVLSLGMNGEAIVNEAGGVHREKLDDGEDSPNSLRTMHSARCIGSHFYAVGMRRQVFCRDISGAPWRRIDSGVFVPDSSKEIAGFLSIDGFDDKEIYAVGYSGEIWLFDGKSWNQQSSPTNARLECVRCQADGTVLISGEAGMVLRGRRDIWTVLEQDLTDETLLSHATLGTKTKFATDAGVLIEYDGKEFSPVKMPEKRQITTSFLDSNSEQILSVGEEDILIFNGRTWSSLSHPQIDPD
jgi:hypothetical protein